MFTEATAFFANFIYLFDDRRLYDWKQFPHYQKKILVLKRDKLCFLSWYLIIFFKYFLAKYRARNSYDC